jgi:hypothetical protein
VSVERAVSGVLQPDPQVIADTLDAVVTQMASKARTTEPGLRYLFRIDLANIEAAQAVLRGLAGERARTEVLIKAAEDAGAIVSGYLDSTDPNGIAVNTRRRVAALRAALAAYRQETGG